MLEKLGGKNILMIVEDNIVDAMLRTRIAQQAIEALPEAERAGYAVHHVESKKEALDTLAGQRRGNFKVIGALLDKDFPHIPNEAIKDDSGIGIVSQMTFANDRTPTMLNTARFDQQAVGKLAAAVKVPEPTLAEGQKQVQLGHITAIEKSNEAFPTIQKFFADAIERSRQAGKSLAL